MPISHQLCSNLIVLTLPLPSVVVQNNPLFPPLLCSLSLLVAFFSFQPHCNWPIISGLIKQNLMTLWEWDVKSKIKKNICAHQLLQGQSYKTGMLVIVLRILPSGYNSCVYGTCVVLCAYTYDLCCVKLYVACVCFYCLWGGGEPSQLFRPSRITAGLGRRSSPTLTWLQGSSHISA